MRSTEEEAAGIVLWILIAQTMKSLWDTKFCYALPLSFITLCYSFNEFNSMWIMITYYAAYSWILVKIVLQGKIIAVNLCE